MYTFAKEKFVDRITKYVHILLNRSLKAFIKAYIKLFRVA